MKYNQPVIMGVTPDDNLFVWMVEVQIEKILSLGMDNECHYLWFIPADRIEIGINPNVKAIENKYKDYPQIKFFHYEDDGSLLPKIRSVNYIPLLRPYTLSKHFKLHPELSNKAIFYCDADILFTKKIDFEPFLNDEICYLSHTGGRFGGGNYLDLAYLRGKIKQALPERVEELTNLNPINRIAKSCGITEEIIEANDGGTGGAQYLLNQ